MRVTAGFSEGNFAIKFMITIEESFGGILFVNAPAIVLSLLVCWAIDTQAGRQTFLA
jgi:hypothetical protein